ncbi:MAG: hypothetical protein B7O98_07870 [Zestosphaera tikiterensis]|uniref:Cytochrome C biogenesis protein transmembrane domain-containing protein n=1 Tax=Zestosphaera tikiterensis TaxID=1973259 RepID=A0A2R7Y4V9_9CREN|nr:MAG: hypothetical protein B7O98_07870 [Zestosphaera tikiterensis]
MDNLSYLIMGFIIPSALADSIDPCIFSLFTSMLISASLTNVGRVFKVGVVFITSVYVGYVAFGFLLRYLAVFIPRYVLGLATLAYGLVTLTYTLLTARLSHEELVCREDRIECRLINALKLTRKSIANLAIVSLLGFIAAFTLLPCSAGLYILFNVITAKYDILTWLALTAIYVAIFITPLILILTAFTGITKVKNIQEKLLKHQTIVKIAGSTLMIAVSAYILATPY